MINNSHRLIIILAYFLIYEFFYRWLPYSDLYYILINNAAPVKSTDSSLSYSIVFKYMVNVTSGVCWDIEAFEVLGTIGIRWR